MSLFLRIKVPFEVALAIIALAIVLWVLVGVGALGRWIDNKLGERATRVLACGLGVALTSGALWLTSTFYFIERNRHHQYRGLRLFDLGDVALTAMLFALGAAAFAWGRLPLLGALESLAAGVALLLKPILLPLVSTFGGRESAFGLTSETHLYFVLSALGLVVLSMVLFVIAVLRRKRRRAPQQATAFGDPTAHLQQPYPPPHGAPQQPYPPQQPPPY